MKNFHQVSNVLKKHFPNYKVSIRRVVVPPDIAGECCLLPTRKKCKQFMIKIDHSLDEDAAILILLHEWSHILSWQARGDDHGIEWGKAYSRIYRVYLKDWIEKENQN
ncbi:MAG: hypothetical protein M0R80_08825 [Proteobacteria bacterium]|nr:hypothetical protein [Pseudomonadota bacterium]